MEQEAKILIGALRKAVSGCGELEPGDINWKKFYAQAMVHNVCALAWKGLQGFPDLLAQIPDEIKTCLSADYFKAIYRDTQLEHVKQALQKELTAAQVPHVFLKGACLKYDYPIPALRTMCDIDLLVRTEDYKKITEIAQGMQAVPYFGDGNHHNFRFPGNVSVECHPNLVHPGTPVGTQINPGWQFTKEEDAFTKEMTAEGVYLNTICHLAEHFVAGGIGVRFVLDVWVCQNLRKEKADRGIVEKELEKCALLDFAKNIEALAHMWFGGGETTPVLEELAEYILSSGSHGNSNMAMLNAVSLSKGGNRSSALWQKVFYPREELETRFPWAKGKPWLLPAAWCARAYGAVTKRGHLIRKWSKGTGALSREEVQAQREKMSRFGIERKKGPSQNE